MFFLIRRFFRYLLILGLIIGFTYLIVSHTLVQRIFYPILYQEHIFQYAHEYNLNPYLVAAVIKVESRFIETAESEPGARGLMQIMPDTAKWAASQMKTDFSLELLFEPAYNIKIGCWYLRQLLNTFDDNLVVALAAYNGGQGNVCQWLNKGIWDGSRDNVEQIPFGETRDYVKKVFHFYHRYLALYQH